MKLVESIEFVRESGKIQEEYVYFSSPRRTSHTPYRWFGLILLPIVSFSADGVVAIVYFLRSIVNHILGKETMVPSQLAKGRAIDLSIQFTLFWMPFLVLLGWWIDKPMHLLFGVFHRHRLAVTKLTRLIDYYELAVVLGSCFLVNYVTADSKTNWVEGLIMVSFYFMIVRGLTSVSSAATDHHAGYHRMVLHRTARADHHAQLPRQRRAGPCWRRRGRGQ